MPLLMTWSHQTYLPKCKLNTELYIFCSTVIVYWTITFWTFVCQVAPNRLDRHIQIQQIQDSSTIFVFSSLPNRDLRGHNEKIFKPYARTDIQKYFFSHQVVEPWNLLSSDIIDSDTVDSFRRRLMRVVPSGEDDLSTK